MIQISNSDLLKVKRLLSYLARLPFSCSLGKEKARQAALLLKKLERRNDSNE